MKRVRQKELDYESDGLYYLDGKPFTGTLEYLAKGGWVQAEEEYRDGLLSGWKREWHRPGALEKEAQCAWGACHGSYREWDEDGRLVVEGTYEYGIRVSGKRWDEDGRVVEDFRLRETDPDFDLLEAFRASHAEAEGGG
jgi:antitoxin component YwqK of YwqJK toxin-antitoxin module